MSHDTGRLFDQVLFDSDRTCCICRDRSRPVKIHHVDGDHYNNERSNLAVVCDPCHTLAHTNLPFSRNLTPDQIRMYDETWQKICATRLLPQSANREIDEYQQEVLLEVTLACHSWKNNYMDLQPSNFQGTSQSFRDIWDLLIEAGQHEDSAEEWNKYRSLFDISIRSVIDSLCNILTCHGDVISTELKTLVIRTNRHLEVERKVFFIFGPGRTSVKSRSQGVLRSLAALARAADARTKASPSVPWNE